VVSTQRKSEGNGCGSNVRIRIVGIFRPILQLHLLDRTARHHEFLLQKYCCNTMTRVSSPCTPITARFVSSNDPGDVEVDIDRHSERIFACRWNDVLTNDGDSDRGAIKPDETRFAIVNRLGVKWFETRSVSSSRNSPVSERPRGTRPAPPVDSLRGYRRSRASIRVRLIGSFPWALTPWSRSGLSRWIPHLLSSGTNRTA